MYLLFLAGIPQQPPMMQPQQHQQYMHTSNGRGNEQDDMLAQIRDHEARDQYSRGRTPPSVVPDNRSYHSQYDSSRETESPNVSIVLCWAHACNITT